jgi:hypothetical protein
MSNRLFRLLSALYPREWRERYAHELADLCDEFAEAREVGRWRLGLNIVVTASVERLRPLRQSGRRLVIGGGATAVVVLVVLVAATDGFGRFSAALPSKGPIPDNAIVNGHIDPGRVPDFVSVVSEGQTVGFTPKSDLITAPASGIQLGVVGVPAIKPVYGSDLKTLVGHVYPGTGFVPLGPQPSTRVCVPESTFTNGKQQPIPCPSAAVGIPNVVGMYTPTGVAMLSSIGLSIQIVNVKSVHVKPGHIIATSPVAGVSVAARSVITVDISVRT